MKIVFVSQWYSEGMGYIENCLPKAVAKLGHEVHLITSTAQVYYNHPYFKQAYGKHLGEPIQPVGERIIEGVNVHRLPFSTVRQKIVLRGLLSKIHSLSPDIVHAFDHAVIDTVRIALFSPFKSFRLFTANHTVTSVSPTAKNWGKLTLAQNAKWRLTEWLPGYIVNFFTEKCFCVTSDALDIAVKLQSVSPSKALVTTLGVDTDVFQVDLSKRKMMRQQYGFSDNDIVCIFSGKLIEQKQPQLLVQAVALLVEKGYPIKAVIIGEGELAATLAQFKGVQIIPFQPFHKVPLFFNMADIGVWPGEESTSQLDAVASGLCLILTDNIKAYDLIEEVGENIKPRIVSRKFQHGSVESLKMAIESLLDGNIRAKLSERGAKTIREQYSWDTVARNRLKDYKEVIGNSR